MVRDTAGQRREHPDPNLRRPNPRALGDQTTACPDRVLQDSQNADSDGLLGSRQDPRESQVAVDTSFMMARPA
jgi:hypothetical protein